ncbi:hypothetical protein NSA19_08125 [Actinomyces bowdenii]|uniref:hypothetical protein n=1 Tax=Actinomyces bowdenii TaxID=131109 RepID=UPI0011CF0A1C|nr:hypothetical protein [Actinomyces bowdenii]MCR2052809.1 hypothetical protein [Actinomyces bowdenii]
MTPSFPTIPQAGAWDHSPPAEPGPQPGAPAEQAAATASSAPGLGAPGSARSAEGAPSVRIHTIKAPVGMLYAAMGAAVLAIVLAAASEVLAVAISSWALAGILGMGAATAFVVRDAARQTDPWYLHTPRTRLLYRATVVVCLLAVIAASVRIALIVGRM